MVISAELEFDNVEFSLERSIESITEAAAFRTLMADY
jgi:hypothetical protein